MTTHSTNGAFRRYRWMIVPAAALAGILLLIVVYRLTTPGTGATSASGERMPEGDVLQVGALPVT